MEEESRQVSLVPKVPREGVWDGAGEVPVLLSGI
jgi:hypothetical protein